MAHRPRCSAVPPTPRLAPVARAALAGLTAALAATLAALVVLVAGAGPAAAHASLLSVDPPHGSVLDESPAQVTLRFSEPVSVELGGVRILDGDGRRVEAGAAQVDGAVVTVGVQPDLPDGTYVISYRIVSADGHPVRGASLFGVGDVALDTGAADRVAGGGGDQVWEVVGGVARALSYAGVLVAAGGAAFLAHAHRGGPERPALVRAVRAAAAVGWVTALVALPVQAALGTGQGPLSLVDDGVLGKVAAEGLGLSLLLLTVGLVLVVVGVDRSAPAAVVGGALAAGSFAAWGHNRAGDHVLVATLADVAHLAAAALWVGGLVLLGLTLRHRRRSGADPVDPVDTGQVVARFSVLATGGIVAVGGAGAALAWTQLESLSDLTDGRYGLFLLAKVALVAAVAALAAYNHFRLVPAMGRGRARAALDRLWTTLRVEVVVLAGVAALTSVLVVTTPPTGQMQLVERIVEVSDGHGSIQIVVDPARAGFNQLHLYTYGPDGVPAELGEALTVELTLPSAGIGPVEVVPPRAGPAHFQLDSSDFALAGEWQLVIRVRVDRFTEAVAETTVPIAS